jgi:hypothetical protein
MLRREFSIARTRGSSHLVRSNELFHRCAFTGVLTQYALGGFITRRAFELLPTMESILTCPCQGSYPALHPPAPSAPCPNPCQISRPHAPPLAFPQALGTWRLLPRTTASEWKRPFGPGRCFRTPLGGCLHWWGWRHLGGLGADARVRTC